MLNKTQAKEIGQKKKKKGTTKKRHIIKPMIKNNLTQSDKKRHMCTEEQR